mgnify:CR=1 FL=1
MASPIITTLTVKRLISDIKEVINSSLSKDRIYYKHDEINMLVGHALIIGPENTPYEYGNFLFKFKFPHDYPHSPPIVTYCTNDGYTRFNPNLYKCGKVCISLLNTWKGEQWTGCQTIKSILLVLCSLLNETPLINEPGIPNDHKDIESYNKIIKYKTVDVAINRMLSKEYLPKEFEIFNDEIKENFINNYDNIKKSIENKENEIISTGVYGLSIKTHYNKLRSTLDKHYQEGGVPLSTPIYRI